MLKVLYMDLETTGLSYSEHDIIHMAMIAEFNGVVQGEHEFKMRPFRIDSVTKEALDVSGFTLDEIKSFPPAEEVFPDIIAALNLYINPRDPNDKFYPVGYNIRFDISFIVELWKRMKDPYLGSYFNWKDIDLLYLMYVYEFLGYHKIANYKLPTVAKYYGIRHVAHDALSDTKVVRKLTHKFLFNNIRMEAHNEKSTTE